MMRKINTTSGVIYDKIRNILRKGRVYINSQKDRLIRRMSLPDEFLRDLEDFEKRNSLVEPKAAHTHQEGVCCIRCLKAYALDRAKKMHLDCSSVAPLFVLMGGETGHNGYYEDNGKIVALS